mgnify:CR=1 FL=1
MNPNDLARGLQASGDGVQRQEHLRQERVGFLAVAIGDALAPILEQRNLLLVKEVDRGGSRDERYLDERVIQSF